MGILRLLADGTRNLAVDIAVPLPASRAVCRIVPVPLAKLRLPGSIAEIAFRRHRMIFDHRTYTVKPGTLPRHLKIY
jgi:hypothetical protein